MGCSSLILLIFRILEQIFSLVVLAGTGAIIHKFSQVRQFNHDFDTIHDPIPQLINDYILATPHRIYLGMFVSIWSLLTAFYLLVFPRIRNGKFAPRALLISLEIFTIIFWFCAFVALALFTVEVEPICMAVDDIPIVKTLVEDCVIMKVVTAYAAFSWVIWCITCIIASIQGCRAKRNKGIVPVAANGYGTGNHGYEMVGRADVGKAEQGVAVTTVELVSR